MGTDIHRLALVDPSAKLGKDVRVGPFCVIEEGAFVGDGTILEARVSIKKGTIIGKNNHIFEGACLGGLPQCVGLQEENCGGLIVGNGNEIRENVTIHRSMYEDKSTVVGNDCMLMANVHIAHDCHVADEVIMANNAMLAGHCSVGKRAFVSGAAGAHQYVRVGAYAMVGGQAHLVRDVPPFVTVDGLSSQVVGLNLIGLKRAGFTSEDRKTLKEAYRIIYKSGLNWNEIVEKIEKDYPEGVGLEMARFLATTQRGITMERACLPTIGEARQAARNAASQDKNDGDARSESIRLCVVDENAPQEQSGVETNSETIQLRVVDENGASLIPPPSRRRAG